MAHAYTPGLKVTENERMRKRRILPLKGEVMVTTDQPVQPDTVVARTHLPGRVSVVNIANALGVDQSDIQKYMVKKEGETVSEGDLIARSKGFLGLFKGEAKANMTGTIESISPITGQVILRGAPERVEIRAYVEGEVVEIVPNEGVVIETTGSLIQGIFGVGGETYGPLVMVCTAPDQVLTPELLKPEHKGAIVVGGSLVTYAALKRAIELKVAGVVVGGFDDQDLRELLGYDLGVAITGHEKLGITLVVTEGFGKITMAPRTFALLQKHVGDRASINGATQIRAGVIRPEVVIPVTGSGHIDDVKKEMGMHIGSPVRVIRAPHFGVLGSVSELPSEPRVLESGSKARVVEIEVAGGKRLLLPRANVELIEE